MGTFAGWLSEQADREDAVGYLAKYWKSVTPGKISAVSGIDRFLHKIEEDYRVQPEGMEEAAWLHGQMQVAAALNGLKFAVDEYHKQQAVAAAVANGATAADLPDAGVRLEGTGSALHIAAAPRERAGEPFDSEPYPERAPGRLPGPSGTSDGDPGRNAGERLSRIEARLDAIAECLRELVLIFAPEPEIDWNELAAMADYSAAAD